MFIRLATGKNNMCDRLLNYLSADVICTNFKTVKQVDNQFLA